MFKTPQNSEIWNSLVPSISNWEWGMLGPVAVHRVKQGRERELQTTRTCWGFLGSWFMKSSLHVQSLRTLLMCYMPLFTNGKWAHELGQVLEYKLEPRLTSEFTLLLVSFKERPEYTRCDDCLRLSVSNVKWGSWPWRTKYTRRSTLWHNGLNHLQARHLTSGF